MTTYYENSPFASIETCPGGFVVINEVQGFAIMDDDDKEKVFTTWPAATAARTELVNHYSSISH
jgi:hypothetical protein